MPGCYLGKAEVRRTHVKEQVFIPPIPSHVKSNNGARHPLHLFQRHIYLRLSLRLQMPYLQTKQHLRWYAMHAQYMLC